MGTLHVICKNERDKRLLTRIFRNIGRKAVFSSDLNDALMIFEKVNPSAVFIVDREDVLTEIKIREIKRVAPFIPIVVLLKSRDSERAVECMKAGAFDCVQFPWTEEEILPAAKKALNLRGTRVELETGEEERKRRIIFAASAFLALFCGFIIGWYYTYSRMKTPPEKKNYRILPYSHPSGIIYAKGRLLISDWYTQALYAHDPGTFEIKSVKSFADLMPSSLAKSENYFWMMRTDGRMEKRLLDSKRTLLSKTRIPGSKITGICFDGLYFWSADAGRNTLRKHLNNDTLKLLEEYRYPGGEISAMTCDNRFIWVVDGKTRDLKKISLEIPGKILETFFIRQIEMKGVRVTGIAKKKGTFYFVAEKGDEGILFSKDEKEE